VTAVAVPTIPSRSSSAARLGGSYPDVVPDARPIGEDHATWVRAALAGLRAAQTEVEEAGAQALLNGSSVRAVAELGLSPNTVAKSGRANGWPTEQNRRRFNESR
jgi:hypothetical protein